MTDIMLTITQALQLVALAPCVFVVAFLLCSARKDGDNVVPVLYFITLACEFIIPLLPIFGEAERSSLALGALLLGASLNVPVSFLLVVQFMQGKIPSPRHWLILLLPLIGGSPFIYATLYSSEVCLDKACYQTDSLRILYNAFSAALVYLLLIAFFSRSTARIAVEDADRKHKYWLVIALVGLNLIIIAINLAQLAGTMSEHNALLIMTVIRIAFIYLVLTSIFRVFYDLFDIELFTEAGSKAPRNPEADKRLVERIRSLLEFDQIYREMGLNRESLAKQLGVSEHQVSRIVNTYFDKNFNELVNDYRIREAKERLLTENTQVTVIAFEVGFSSIASFNRVFREMAGASPTEFRNFHKNSVR